MSRWHTAPLADRYVRATGAGRGIDAVDWLRSPASAEISGQSISVSGREAM